MTSGLTYDTGALLAAERGQRSIWALHRASLMRELPPVVPAAVLAQAWRGGPQAELYRLLAGCEVEALTDRQARAAGGLAVRAKHPDIVDVSVVEGAIRRRHAVVTTDARHIRAIAAAARVHLVIHEV